MKNPHLVRRGLWMMGLGIATIVCACDGSGAAKNASALATTLSAHITTLNSELTTFATTANDNRQEAATRLADGEVAVAAYGQELQGLINIWQLTGNKQDLGVLSLLKTQSQSEMAVTESLLKQEQDAANNLSTSFGKVNFDPKKLQSVVSSLQTLASQETSTNQLQIAVLFGSAVLSDMKAQNAKTSASLSSTLPKIENFSTATKANGSDVKQ